MISHHVLGLSYLGSVGQFLEPVLYRRIRFGQKIQNNFVEVYVHGYRFLSRAILKKERRIPLTATSAIPPTSLDSQSNVSNLCKQCLFRTGGCTTECSERDAPGRGRAQILGIQTWRMRMQRREHLEIANRLSFPLTRALGSWQRVGQSYRTVTPRWGIRATCFDTELCQAMMGGSLETVETYPTAATAVEYGGGLSPAGLKTMSRFIG